MSSTKPTPRLKISGGIRIEIFDPEIDLGASRLMRVALLLLAERRNTMAYDMPSREWVAPLAGLVFTVAIVGSALAIAFW
jgi:hypothetical protein